jgi:hypothetical protein
MLYINRKYPLLFTIAKAIAYIVAAVVIAAALFFVMCGLGVLALYLVVYYTA